MVCLGNLATLPLELFQDWKLMWKHLHTCLAKISPFVFSQQTKILSSTPFKIKNHGLSESKNENCNNDNNVNSSLGKPCSRFSPT